MDRTDKGGIGLGTDGSGFVRKSHSLKGRNNVVLHRTNAVARRINQWLRQWKTEAQKELPNLIAIGRCQH